MAKRTTVKRFKTGFVEFEQEVTSYSDLREGFDAHNKSREDLDPLELATYAEDVARAAFVAHGFPKNISGRWHRLDGGPIQPGPAPLEAPMKISMFRDGTLFQENGDQLGSVMHHASMLASMAMMYRLAVARADLKEAVARAFELGQGVQRILRFAETPVDGETVDAAALTRLDGKRARSANAKAATLKRTANSLASRQRALAVEIEKRNPALSLLSITRLVIQKLPGSERTVRRTIAPVLKKSAPTK